MKKHCLFILASLIPTTALPAQITREQADNIVYEYIQSKIAQACYLYINENVEDENSFTMTTEHEEILSIHYPCWIYCLNEWPNESKPYPSFLYFFVSKNSGKLLEVKTKYDSGPDDLTEWQLLASTKMENVLSDRDFLNFPNPTGDILSIAYTDNIHCIKIHDFTGKQVFYESFPQDKNGYEANISFLVKGVYILSAFDKNGKIINYKIIKK